MESRVIPPPQASARQTELGDVFNRTLFAALDAMEDKNIPYAMIGGIAASGLGRPRSTHDIDFFVRPEDAEAALDALFKHGFDTERTDERWLFKGWKESMMVDIIFKSSGDIYFDQEMQERTKPVDYHGRKVKLVAPEDLIVIKAAVHSEIGPHHWHDALAVLSHAELDWKYLLKRARRANRRILSLLIYAQSNDIWIPNSVILELHKQVFGDISNFSSKTEAKPIETPKQESPTNVVSEEVQLPPDTPDKIHDKVQVSVQKANQSMGKTDAYFIADLKDILARDPRTSTLDVKLHLVGNRILCSGELPTKELRTAVEKVIRENAENFEIDNRIAVSEMKFPESVEELQ